MKKVKAIVTILAASISMCVASFTPAMAEELPGGAPVVEEYSAEELPVGETSAEAIHFSWEAGEAADVRCIQEGQYMRAGSMIVSEPVIERATAISLNGKHIRWFCYGDSYVLESDCYVETARMCDESRREIKLWTLDSWACPQPGSELRTVAIDVNGEMVYLQGKEGFTWEEIIAANPEVPMSMNTYTIGRVTVTEILFYGSYRLAVRTPEGYPWVMPEHAVNYYEAGYMAYTMEYFHNLVWGE